MKLAKSSPTHVHIPKIQSINANHPNAGDLQSAHVFTSIGHDDGRDYVDGENQMVRFVDLRGLTQAETFNTATSGDVTSHQGVSLNKSRDKWVTSHSENVGPVTELFQWSAIGTTPTPDATNPTNGNLLSHDDFSGFSNLNHAGDIAHFSSGGTEYIAVPLNHDRVSDPPLACGIALYNATTLAYIAGSYSDLIGGFVDAEDGEQLDPSALAVNESKNELYITEFKKNSDYIYVFTLSDAVTGSCTLKRTINFDTHIENKQGIYCKGDDFYIVADDFLLYKFNSVGALQTVYSVHATGSMEGLDFSSDILYWLDSPTTTTGFIETYDVYGAENAQVGRVPDGVNIEQFKSLISKMVVAFPESGTIILRMKYTINQSSWSRTAIYLFDTFNTSSSWLWTLQKGGGDVRARFTATSGTTIDSAANGVPDLLPDTTYDLAITWNKDGSNVDTEIHVDAVLRDSDTAVWNTSVPTNQVIGPVNRFHTIDMDAGLIVAHRHLFNKVLTLAEIAFINANPDDLFNVE